MNAEVGMRKSEVGMRNAEVGMRNAEVGVRNQSISARRRHAVSVVSAFVQTLAHVKNYGATGRRGRHFGLRYGELVHPVTQNSSYRIYDNYAK